MEEIIANFARFLIENNLTIEYDYDVGWIITKNESYIEISLISELISKLGIDRDKSSDFINFKLKKYTSEHSAKRTIS